MLVIKYRYISDVVLYSFEEDWAMEIYSNEYFDLEEDKGAIYISVYQKGFSLKDFDGLLKALPRVEINKFMNLKKGLEEPTGAKIHVGNLRPVVDCKVSKDKMEAKIKLNCTQEDFKDNRSGYLSMILEVLTEQGVKEGILKDVLAHELIPCKETLIAEGLEPVNGEDAIVNYYQLSERKPTIREDGTADYYDMSFIDEVNEGDWLGEKTPPSEGKHGRTVTGEILPPKKGKDRRVLYDKKTVKEVEEDGKIVLRALVDGAVSFIDGKITVGKHLRIDGDVGVETGNIDFEGSVEVAGTVQAGFTVTAVDDVSVLSELGIRGAALIESKEADVFIKGGIFGQDRTVIRAGKNIYVKHANECTLEAAEDINIGYYAKSSRLKSKNVLTDDRKGKIIGGEIEAKGKVISAFIGNKMEQKTLINIEGFDREKIKDELQELLMHYKKVVKEVETTKRQMEIFESFKDQLDEQQKSDYESIIEKYEEYVSNVAQIEDHRKGLMKLLETKGEGQVIILNEAFPEVMLEIKQLRKKLQKSTKGSFFALGKELHFE